MKKFIAILIASFALIALPGTSQKIEKKPGIERRVEAPQLAVMDQIVLHQVAIDVIHWSITPADFQIKEVKQDHSDFIYPVLQQTIKPDRNIYKKDFTWYSKNLGKKFIRNPDPPIRTRA